MKKKPFLGIFSCKIRAPSIVVFSTVTDSTREPLTNSQQHKNVRQANSDLSRRMDLRNLCGGVARCWRRLLFSQGDA